MRRGTHLKNLIATQSSLDRMGNLFSEELAKENSKDILEGFFVVESLDENSNKSEFEQDGKIVLSHDKIRILMKKICKKLERKDYEVAFENMQIIFKTVKRKSN